MTHSTTMLFAHFGNWLLAWTRESRPLEHQPRSPAPVQLDAERDRLPPRDEGFYWAWQYWSQ
ncbi:hypothetical protein [Mesorhizobium sp. LjNodule214]|uniref:hypothetical protein n=1 Tax=Mesorhizobium sp. LjNodule214 TaxID=3342252 RepID=UPI003ED0C816